MAGNTFRRFLVLFLVFSGTTLGYAKIKLPALVGDNMVLQRNAPIKIWGYADPREIVAVAFKDKIYKTTAENSGAWKIVLPAQNAGGPYRMTVSGTNTIELKNILIGDVWLCSGQSNMYFTMAEVKNAETEIKRVKSDSIRLFFVPTNIATAPQRDISARWVQCDTSSVKYFSAVAYFFAKNLQGKIKVPLGLIESSYGGTPVEAWISAVGLQGDPQFGPQAATLSAMNMDTVNKKMEIEFNKWVDSLERSDPGYTNGTYDWSKITHPDWKQMELPAYFENKDKALKDRDGIIWFSKQVMLTKEEAQNSLSLHIGPVVHDDLIFVNGNKIGGTRDAKYRPRIYKIPAGLLHAGPNVISIRVIDYGEFAGINGKPEQFFLETNEKHISISGSWNYRQSLDTVFKTIHYARLNQERVPSLLFNAMIAPVTLSNIKGVIWYQGEQNTPRAYQYTSLFQRLIVDWRNMFLQPKLPFLYVQLANNGPVLTEPGNSTWAELREAQSKALKLPNTGMAAALDIGEATNIHFKNKQDVGLRLSLIARKVVYGEKTLLEAGPVYEKTKFETNRCVIYLKNAGSGLTVKDSGKYVNGFQILTDKNKKFEFITAKIIGRNMLTIGSPRGEIIQAVRYAWADSPVKLNLVNSAGLPAYPFRTDSFKEITYDKRYDMTNK